MLGRRERRISRRPLFFEDVVLFAAAGRGAAQSVAITVALDREHSSAKIRTV
jgi:hypothetical protein